MYDFAALNDLLAVTMSDIALRIEAKKSRQGQQLLASGQSLRHCLESL